MPKTKAFIYCLVNESIFFLVNPNGTPGMGRATGERKECANANMD